MKRLYLQSVDVLLAYDECNAIYRRNLIGNFACQLEKLAGAYIACENSETAIASVIALNAYTANRSNSCAHILRNYCFQLCFCLCGNLCGALCAYYTHAESGTGERLA